MIKAIFFDIDGTLVSFRTHRIPDNTMQALQELKANGIKIFIATGRSGILMKEIGTLDPDMFDGVITFNGQYCRAGRHVVHSHPIPAEDAQAGIRFFDSCNIPCLFEGADFMIINSSNDNSRKAAALLDMRLPEPANLSTVGGKDILQLIFFGNAAQEKELMCVLPSCESTRWHPDFTDIIPRGGGKHVGMEKMLAHFGIDRSECMAFGDGGNDISMLRHAAIGVAMGNASDAVKEAADYITSGVDDDGISAALRHFGIV